MCQLCQKDQCSICFRSKVMDCALIAFMQAPKWYKTALGGIFVFCFFQLCLPHTHQSSTWYWNKSKKEILYSTWIFRCYFEVEESNGVLSQLSWRVSCSHIWTAPTHPSALRHRHLQRRLLPLSRLFQSAVCDHNNMGQSLAGGETLLSPPWWDGRSRGAHGTSSSQSGRQGWLHLHWVWAAFGIWALFCQEPLFLWSWGFFLPQTLFHFGPRCKAWFAGLPHCEQGHQELSSAIIH